MNEIDFSTLATQCSIFPDRRSKEQAIRTHAAIKAMWKKKTTTTTTDTSQNTGLNMSAMGNKIWSPMQPRNFCRDKIVRRYVRSSLHVSEC